MRRCKSCGAEMKRHNRTMPPERCDVCRGLSQRRKISHTEVRSYNRDRILALQQEYLRRNRYG